MYMYMWNTHLHTVLWDHPSGTPHTHCTAVLQNLADNDTGQWTTGTKRHRRKETE